jgi:ABC-type antimicrobial peptide transport system permease subunit
VNNKKQDWTIVPTALAPVIKEEIQEVENYVRFARTRGIIRYEDKVFNESIAYTDADFFEMFTFPLNKGDKNVFKSKTGIIISSEIAQKYFGSENPVGKRITLSYTGEKFQNFIVGGVTAKFPKNSSIVFDILLPYSIYQKNRNIDDSDWKSWCNAVFIQTKSNTNSKIITDKIRNYISFQNNANPDRKVQEFYLDPLLNIAHRAHLVRGEILPFAMHPSAVYGPAVTAFLTLLLACFNFMNTSVAYSSRRLKEIGIRKVIGGHRRQLIAQFLGENFLLCILAFVTGMILAKWLVPVYDSLWPDISLDLDYSNNIGIFGFILVLISFTGIAAGAYPAFYISRFNPTEIIKGQQKLGNNNFFKRTMIVFQFSISIMAIISAFILSENADFQKNIDLGFEKDRIIVAPIKTYANYRLYKSEILSHPDIIETAGSSMLVGRRWSRTEVESNLIKSEVNVIDVGENYMEISDFRLLKGRFFMSDRESADKNSVVVNENFVKEFAWDSPLGKHIKMGSEEFKVIGVIKDFLPNGLFLDVRPFFMRLTDKENYRYISIKFNSQNPESIMNDLKITWKRLFPNLPFEGFYQDEVLLTSLRTNDSIKTAFIYNSITTVFIACMGLFALVSLNIVKKIKEIGIRKVLGATTGKITLIVSREFVILLLISVLIGTWCGYYLMNFMLSTIFAYTVGFKLMPFFSSTVLIFLFSLLTVSYQVFKAASSNPADCLRDE